MRHPLLARLSLSVLVAALGVASPLAAQESVQYIHTDAIGNVRAITDANGTVIERHDYLPFGEECTTGPCAANPGVGAGLSRKFTGKERDPETGLDYFGARYYRANTGRFTTVDPVYTLQANIVDPQRWNRYAYAVPFATGGGIAVRGGGKILGRADDAARVISKNDDATNALGVVYRRTDPKSGAEYIGRSKSDEAFLNRQRTHDRNLGTKHEYEIVARAAPGTPLRVSEESAIRTRGGPGRLANKRYEMNDAKYRACGGTCDKPKQ